ncbi:2-hydroxyhepta-2,4-diene-1,7-dioate isomerase [Sphingomonas spermidinifaciens]|uniref:2-hydroxyhepta-2,4-diene-1,7-dioate isomerase n=1 Tax=Sphingomonas spermidinifaciens TaxID=1141889 RepID=A0A2A4B7Z8_9SPHN|nr:fumarylacetoacetate hydrolase family protein [Sphingomonas spermidinifaciens]PCD04207.1 2-hydroxyhepta-2,4-diene-1,7-dioate isomerase [Sphingomonas spermidinifaciens]
MKLLRHGPVGQERPGLVDAEGIIRDLSSIVADIDPTAVTPEGLASIAAVDPATLPAMAADTRLGPCVGRPGKFICIGLNFADHAAESNMPIPEEPVVFMKATSALSGPNDPIIKPRGSTKLDWEVELAFVVGKECRYVDEAEAAAAIAGYCVCNDVSERAFQMQSSQWDKGKGCDSFGPLGPWLVTADEVGDTSDLHMWLEVNGHRYQDGSTQTMIFKPAFILAYLSRFFSLQPGDVVTTGTPPGVGLGQNPQVWLNEGDRVSLGIAGLGEQHQIVVSA